VGGHTVRDTEIRFGYAVTGTVDPAAADDVRAELIKAGCSAMQIDEVVTKGSPLIEIL
jgi:selenophosphate synthase